MLIAKAKLHKKVWETPTTPKGSDAEREA